MTTAISFVFTPARRYSWMRRMQVAISWCRWLYASSVTEPSPGGSPAGTSAKSCACRWRRLPAVVENGVAMGTVPEPRYGA